MKVLDAVREVLHEEVVYFEIGQLATLLADLTITREDLVVTIRRGVIGVGTVGEEPVVRSGIAYIQPNTNDWAFAVTHGASIPVDEEAKTR